MRYILIPFIIFLGIAYLRPPVGDMGINSQHSPNKGVSKTQSARIGKTEASAPLWSVSRVVDGDTIIAKKDSVEERVRLIGVDTPESVDPRKAAECFGKEAAQFTRELAQGKSIRMESDRSQNDRDVYGRLLRYVFLEDGTLLNHTIIAKGYGHEYTHRLPYRYQRFFKKAERKARSQRAGLWAQDACKK